ncbi:MAG: zf-HC2 domain-containing protein [Gemmatimonadaceae bacterium]
MTGRTIGCEQFEALLADYMEDALDTSARAAMDTHTQTCDRCNILLADLRDITQRARSLPVLAPSRDLWLDVAARTESAVVSLAERAQSRSRPRTPAPFWLAAAAAAIVVSVGATYVATIRFAVPGDTAAAKSTLNATPGVQLAANDLQESVEVDYGREIDRLRAVLDERRRDVDSATVAIIERNLATIDSAIADSRAALERDPASQFLSRQLLGALSRKVNLLRTAAFLPSQT